MPVRIHLTSLVRLITAALCIAVLAGTWDVWWHSAVGRDTFWEPPHILLYSSVTAAICMSVYGWKLSHQAVWRRLAILLLLVPLSGPFDELWHRSFGVELLSSPLIIWSPPHLALLTGVVGSFLLLLPLLARENDPTARQFFGGLCLASILSILYFLASPLEPIGPYSVLGFWGAGILAAVVTGMLLVAKRWMPGDFGATIVAIFFLLLQSVPVSSKVLLEAGVPPHDHSPRWLILFATLLSAIFIDVAGHRLPAWVHSTVVAILWSSLVFGFSSQFLESQFQYGAPEMWTAIIASAICGLMIGIVISAASRSRLSELSPQSETA